MGPEDPALVCGSSEVALTSFLAIQQARQTPGYSNYSNSSLCLPPGSANVTVKGQVVNILGHTPPSHILLYFLHFKNTKTILSLEVRQNQVMGRI